MPRIVNDEALDSLFRIAQCHYAWLPQPVGDTLLRAVSELVRRAPVAAAARPARIAFVKSEEARAQLALAVPEPLRDAVASAPVAAVLGCAPQHRNEPDLDQSALRAGYLMLAARSLGLDCGPVWQFDAAAVNAALFADGSTAATFLCALGYADATGARAAEARPACDILCTIL